MILMLLLKRRRTPVTIQPYTLLGHYAVTFKHLPSFLLLLGPPPITTTSASLRNKQGHTYDPQTYDICTSFPTSNHEKKRLRCVLRFIIPCRSFGSIAATRARTTRRPQINYRWLSGDQWCPAEVARVEITTNGYRAIK